MTATTWTPIGYVWCPTCRLRIVLRGHILCALCEGELDADLPAYIGDDE